MKNKTNRMTVALAVLAGMAGSTVLAQDLTPPWRGQPGSAYSEWRFNTSANPAAPEQGSGVTPARATIAPGPYNTGWLSQTPGMGTQTGVWDLGSSGTVTVFLNEAGGAGLQRISVQVSQWLDGGIYSGLAVVTVPGAMSEWADVGMGSTATVGGWFVDASDWVVPAGTTVDRILITGARGGSVIDQVTVDTLSAVAPAAALSIRPLTGASGDPGRVEVFWTATPGSYVLESTTNLADAQSWEPVDAPVQVTGNLHSVPLESTGAARFFRLKKQ